MKNHSRMEIEKKIMDAKHIYMYGAGMVAKNVLRVMQYTPLNIPFECVVVSKKDDRTQVEGIEIKEIKDLDVKGGEALFILALSKSNQNEVKILLSSLRYNNYLIWDEMEFYTLSLLSQYHFEDRRRNPRKTCFVLCGYKQFLWDEVFKRLIRFVPKDVEICLMTSGERSSELSELAEKHGWSYVSTEHNSVTLVQNVAYELFDTTEWIYKMDEDIFVTEHSFERMMDTYLRAENEAPYDIGLVSPLIPLNGQGYIRILDYIGKRELYEKSFERAKYGGFPERMLESSPEVARFMWGKGGHIPKIDRLNEIFAENNQYSFCSTRLSIGFVLFKRSFWERLGTFTNLGEINLGTDESMIGTYCMNESQALALAENTVCGHFSFGNSTGELKEFYQSHPEYYRLEE